MNPVILLVDDNGDILDFLSNDLCDKYQVFTAFNGKEALDILNKEIVHLIISDIMMPVMDGVELLHNIKNDPATASVPVILLSARAGEEARIEGYDTGADDYLVKPFHLSELNARISAVIRRRRFGGQKVMVLNELTIDLTGKSVYVRDKKVDLTRKEYDLLLFFASNKNKVVSKNSIAEHISGAELDIFDNLDFVYTHIKNLKRKLFQAGGQDTIKSVYGMGYKLEL